MISLSALVNIPLFLSKSATRIFPTKWLTYSCLLIGSLSAHSAYANTCPGGVSESTTATSHTISCSAADFSISSSITVFDDGFGFYTLSELNNATAEDESNTPVSLNDILTDGTCYQFTSTDAATSGAVYKGTIVNNVGFTDVAEGACSGTPGPGPGPGPGPVPPVTPVVTSPTSTSSTSYVVSGTHPVDGTIISVIIDANENGVIDFDEPPATGPVDVAGGAWSTAPIAITATTTFLVVANDPISGLPSAAVSHTVTLNSVNSAPVITSSVFTLTLNEDATVAATLVLTATDADADNLTWSVSSASKGVATIAGNNATATISYLPGANNNGADSFTVTVSDGVLTDSESIAVTITPVNDLPQASNISTATNEDVPLTITLQGSDADNDPLTYQLQSLPGHGSATISGNVVTYTPNLNFNGPDSFSYTVQDAEATSAPATVSITVNAVNDAPIISGTPTTQIDADSDYSFTPTASDIDDDTLSFSVTGQPAWASFNPATGTLSGRPVASDAGTYSNIIISVSDGTTSTALSAFAIEVVALNSPPVAEDFSFNADEDLREAVLDTPATDANPDDTLTYALVTPPLGGTVELYDGPGNSLWLYKKNKNFYGTDSFVYSVSDGKASATGTVTINVSPINDAPTFTSTDFSMTVDEDATVPVTLEITASDVDDETLTWVLGEATKGIATITSSTNTSATISYLPAASENGADGFTVTVSDDEGFFAKQDISVTINPINDTPKLLKGESSQLTLDAGTEVIIDLTQYVEDEESSFADGSLTATTVSSDIKALVAATVENLVTLTALPEASGTHTLTITFTDADEASVVHTIAVEISEDKSLAFICEDADLALTATVAQPFAYNVSSCFENATRFEVGDEVFKQEGNIPAPQWLESYGPPNDVIFRGTPSKQARTAFYLIPITAFNDATQDSITKTYKISVKKAAGPSMVAPAKVELDATGASYEVSGRTLLGIPAANEQDYLDEVQKLVNNGNGVPKITKFNGKDSSTGTAILTSGKHTVTWQMTDVTGVKSAEVEQEVLIWPKLSFNAVTEVDAFGESQTGIGRLALSGEVPVKSALVNIQFDNFQGDCSDDLTPIQLGETKFTLKEITDTFLFADGFAKGSAEEYNKFRPYCEVRYRVGYLDAPYRNYPKVSEEGWTGYQTINITNLPRKLVRFTSTQTLSGVSTTEYRAEFQNALIQQIAESIGVASVNLTTLVTASSSLLTASTTVQRKEAVTSFEQSSNDPIDLEFEQDTNTIAVQLPSELPAGVYQFTFNLIDNNGISGKARTLLKLVDTLPTLSASQDSDGDGLVDLGEGFTDSNNNGIADYLDNVEVAYQLPLNLNDDAFIQCPVGYLCALGPYSMAAGGDGAAISQAEWSQLSQINDSAMNPISDIVDFTVRELLSAGQTVELVIPLQQPISLNSIYRTYVEGEWSSWVENDDSVLKSAPSDAFGACPFAGSTDYREGLNPGDLCIQLTFVDGGPNDADGIANGEIYSTGMLALADNLPPVLSADQVAVPINGSANINLLDNDTDPDADQLELLSVSSNLAEVTFDSDGSVQVIPFENVVGDLIFSYRVQDSQGAQAESTLTVTVAPNQAPVTENDLASTDDRTPILIDVLANDSDPEGSSLTIDFASAEQGTVEIENNQLRYTPPAGYSGVDNIVYIVIDSLEGESNATVEVTVVAYQTVISENKSGGSMGNVFMILLAALALVRCRLPLLMLVVLSPAVFADNWYGQLEIGQARTAKPTVPSQVTVLREDLSDRLWGLTLGYQLTGYWSVEAGYLDLGETQLQLQLDATDTDAAAQQLANIQPLLAEGLTVGARYTPWRNESWLLSVPVGIFSWQADTQSRVGASTISNEQDGLDWYAGISLNRKVSERFSIAAHYRYIDLPTGNVDALSIGVGYQF